MLDTAYTLYRFFSSFGLPAFVENNVPDVPGLYEPPYITYELREPEPGKQTSLVARVWYLEDGFENISKTVDEIKTAVGQGLRLPSGDGILCIWLDEPFCQYQPPDEPKIKIAYLMFVLGAYKT